MKKDFQTYWTLFVSTFLLSAFTFGGGYVIVPLMQKKFVEDLKWIDRKEILDLVAIAQSSPGAIAINTSILLGYRIAGVIGTAIAILGAVLPPLIIISLISIFYDAFRSNIYIAALLKGMRIGVAAIITDVVLQLGHNVIRGKKIVYIIVMILSFIAVVFFKINILYIILVAGIVGAIQSISKKNTKSTQEQ